MRGLDLAARRIERDDAVVGHVQGHPRVRERRGAAIRKRVAGDVATRDAGRAELREGVLGERATRARLRRRARRRGGVPRARDHGERGIRDRGRDVPRRADDGRHRLDLDRRERAIEADTRAIVPERVAIAGDVGARRDEQLVVLDVLRVEPGAARAGRRAPRPRAALDLERQRVDDAHAARGRHYISTVTLLCDGAACMPIAAFGLEPLCVVLQSWKTAGEPSSFTFWLERL